MCSWKLSGVAEYFETYKTCGEKMFLVTTYMRTCLLPIAYTRNIHRVYITYSAYFATSDGGWRGEKEEVRSGRGRGGATQ